MIIPFMAQEYIHVMLFWTHRQYSLALPFNAKLFNLADAEYWMQKMHDADEATKDQIKKPDTFKKDTEWLVWSECHQHRISPEGATETIYSNEMEKRKAKAVAPICCINNESCFEALSKANGLFKCQ
jgi:hypothetical protein